MDGKLEALYLEVLWLCNGRHIQRAIRCSRLNFEHKEPLLPVADLLLHALSPAAKMNPGSFGQQCPMLQVQEHSFPSDLTTKKTPAVSGPTQMLEKLWHNML